MLIISGGKGGLAIIFQLSVVQRATSDCMYRTSFTAMAHLHKSAHRLPL